MINASKGGELPQAKFLRLPAFLQVMTEEDKYFMVILPGDSARCRKTFKIL
jgi:hypothetical protein